MAMGRTVTYIEPPSLRGVRPLVALKRLPQFYDLLTTLSIHRIKVRYKQSRLGIAWAVLQPVAMMLVFTLMFSFLGGAPSHGVPYAVFAFAALLPWSAFSSGLSASAGALTSHAALLTKVYFPREILPLTYVVAAITDFLIGSTVLCVLMGWYGIGVQPLALWAIPAVVLLAAFLTGAGLLLSALQVQHRDVALGLPVLLQIWMFATPIIYPLSAVRLRLPAPLYTLYLLNPMTGVVDTFRSGVVLQQSPDAAALLAAALVVGLLLPVAYVYFKYAERTMADVV
jgi:lipopolysaccharide transport system permease protein